MRIGEFARLANASVRAVRFYDQTGLLSASDVDANTGYREYDVQQLTRMREIRALQELGFSLREIRELLSADLPQPELRHRMEKRRWAIRRQIRQDMSRLERIEEHLRGLARRGATCSPITLQTSPEAWVVSLRAKLQSYDEADEMFAELEHKVPGHLLTARRSAFWHRCDSSGGPIDCEVVRFMKKPISAIRGLNVYQLPRATVASILHCGTDDSLGESYKQLTRWMALSEFRLRGPKREIYWVEPPSRSDRESVTEIQFPVTRVSARRHQVA